MKHRLRSQLCDVNKSRGDDLNCQAEKLTSLYTGQSTCRNQWAIRKQEGRKWQELHRNIYLASIIATIHYLWLSKLEALLWHVAYAFALAILLGWRVQERRRKAIPVPPIQAAKPLKFFKQKPD